MITLSFSKSCISSDMCLNKRFIALGVLRELAIHFCLILESCTTKLNFWYFDFAYVFYSRVRLNKRQKCFIGFISYCYYDSCRLTNETFGRCAEIVLLYEPLRHSILTINPLFSGRKSRGPLPPIAK